MMIYRKILFFLVMIFLSSCSDNVIQDFESNELIIVSSKEDSLYSSPAIYNFFKMKNRYLPIEEDYYNITWIRPEDFNRYINAPSIVCINLENPKDDLGNKLYNRIFQNREDNSKVNFIENFYADNQTIIGIESADVIELNNILFDYRDILIEQVDLNINQLILDRSYELPLNQEISSKIKNKYGIEVFIDHEYQLLNTNDDIFWVGRGLPDWGDPYRWIVIRDIPECKKPDLCHFYIQDTFEQLLSDSIYISINKMDDFQSYKYIYKNNYIIGGTYIYSDIINDNNKLDTIPNAGGPYITYIYNEDNRSIMLIGLVSNPGNDKMIYIKELESIFKDIK